MNNHEALGIVMEAARRLTFHDPNNLTPSTQLVHQALETLNPPVTTPKIVEPKCATCERPLTLDREKVFYICPDLTHKSMYSRSLYRPWEARLMQNANLI